MSEIVALLQNVQATLEAIGPIAALLLILGGGILLGASQLTSAETRGRWQMGGYMVVLGGIITGAVTAAAPSILNIAKTLLVP